MKRIVYLLLSLILLVTMSPLALAAEQKETTQIIYYEDGSSLEIAIVQADTRSSNTTSGRKTFTYKDSSGNTDWIAVLTGSYIHDGTTANCTYADCQITIYDTAYYVVSKSAEKNGASATTTFTIGRTVLGFTVAKDTHTINLTCSPDGKLS